MLAALASPSVCVIDDEKADYEPILVVLNSCFVSSVHLVGTTESLPPEPFSRLQLVFLDLHLSGTIGKDAASYTANFFRKTVSPNTAPLVVVIWSKYAADVPAGEEETEAELFRRTLLEAVPDYNGRLIFVEMAKPKQDVRPADWRDKLKEEIERALERQSAIEVLWAWNELVKEGCAKISREMTLVAKAAVAGPARSLQDGLKATMQTLAGAQSEGDLVPAAAPRYLVSALTQLLVDQLENPAAIASIAGHGDWLSEIPTGPVPADFQGKMNSFLLTSDSTVDAGIYLPGTVFRITDTTKFPMMFGEEVTDLLAVCFRKNTASPKWADWQRDARPVLIEVSPTCDIAQGRRINSLLIAGVVVQSSYDELIKKEGEAFGCFPKFHLRWPIDDLGAQDVLLSYCHTYKVTLPAAQLAAWLTPWFRMRDLPAAAIRNANAAHASRVGFVSVA